MVGIFYVIFIILTVLAALAIVQVIRGATQRPKEEAPVEVAKPFVDFPPPPGVVRTRGVTRVGYLALAWFVVNLAGIVAFVAMGMSLGDDTATIPIGVRITGVVYLLIATAYAGLGGIFLLSAKAQGRRLLGWSGFLYATLMFLLTGIALMIWGSPATTLAERKVAKVMAVALGLHLVIDTVMAVMAQRVGLPKGATEAAPTASEG